MGAGAESSSDSRLSGRSGVSSFRSHEGDPMPANLASALITKLAVSNHLDGEDIRAIQGLRIRERHLGARENIVADGVRPGECCLIVEGFAFRSQTTADG